LNINTPKAMMRLSKEDYIIIYILALQCNSIEEIMMYFERAFNEFKKYNPLPLFIYGLTEAYKYFCNEIEKHYAERMEVCDIMPEQVLLKYKNFNWVKPLSVEMQLSGERYVEWLEIGFNLKNIELIKKGLDAFVEKHSRPQQSDKGKPLNGTQSFKSTLTESQKSKLFNELLNSKFIHKDTKESHFKAVFSGNLPVDFSHIEWIDKGTTRHEPNAQTLFELLYLLKPYIDKENYDTSASNEANFYRLIKNCFANVKNMPEKNPAKAQGDTPRKKLLKTIVDSLKI